MSKKFFIPAIILLLPLVAFAKNYSLYSPDRSIELVVKTGKDISYDINFKGKPLVKDGAISLTAGGKVMGTDPMVKKAYTQKVNSSISPVVPFKFSTIDNSYNQLLLVFKGDYSLEFRMFNDGMAYRFIIDKEGPLEIDDELFGFRLPENSRIHGQLAESFQTAYEEPYSHLYADEWSAYDNRVTLLPLLIEAPDNRKILICESDLSDYPCMFLKPSGGSGIRATFPHTPLKFNYGDRTASILEEASYIALTDGTRAFPWRYLVITDDDRNLIENTMTARLSRSSEISDTSWITPGTTTWEWWNGATPYGTDVDFEAGCNTATYKYFVDFAKTYGINYILLDEGWASSISEPFKANQSLDLPELLAYAHGKDVGVILWLPWPTVEKNFDTIFQRYADMGIAGMKVDFMDRSDQWTVNFYERAARAAADNGLIIDFHGSFKPSGLEYRYPNILSYEGVRGMEQMGGCTPDNSLYFPFIRNAVGPMDYTPGAMLSYQPDKYRCDRPNAGSIGTRAYQLALYILWDTGLQMLADNPTLYYANDDCTRFIAGIPVQTDFTKALEAKTGEFAIVAKRKGDDWYVGGIVNGDQHWRQFDITLDFLDDGEYILTAFEDGVNSPTQAMHYVKSSRKVRKGDKISLKMARNGGYAAIIQPER